MIGNLELQLVATLIIKPKSLSAGKLDKLDCYTTGARLADRLNAYVAAQHSEKVVDARLTTTRSNKTMLWFYCICAKRIWMSPWRPMQVPAR